MPIKINDTFLTPAPIVTYSKTYEQTAGSGFVGAEYSISLNGTLIAFKGNPESTGVTPTVSFSSGVTYGDYNADNDPINTSLRESGYLNAIMLKQEHVRNLFSADPLKIEILGFGQESGVSAYCTVDSIDFNDKSRWTSICEYTVNLKTSRFTNSINDALFPSDSTEDSFSYYVSNVSEDWTIAEEANYTASTGDITDQQKLYNVSHTASAVGKRTYENGVLVTPISQASGYVHNVIGLGGDSLPANYLNIPSSYTTYNRTISESINPFTGSYSVTEALLYGPSGQSASEVVQISIESDLSPFTRVSVNGTINGFNTSGVTDSDVNKYDNANTYWSSVSGEIYSRANTFLDEYSLNSTPLSKTIGKNTQEGVISYAYNFDNRPTSSISGALSEDIQISDIYPGQNINVVPVIGRSQPIIQYVNSRSEFKRSLQISASMPLTSGNPVKPSTSELTTIYDLYKPVASSVYYGPPTENWNPRTGQYSYSIEWTYEGPE
jgi:hypothetical protein